MGCGSCSTGGCGTKPNGCNSNGGCATGGCNKLNTFDWFQGMQQPTRLEHENIYEIRFKNTRKGFFRNASSLSLITGDFVAVESERGFDVGQVVPRRSVGQLQMKKKRVNPESDKFRKFTGVARMTIGKAEKAVPKSGTLVGPTMSVLAWNKVPFGVQAKTKRIYTPETADPGAITLADPTR